MNSMDRGPHSLAEIVQRALSVTDDISSPFFEEVPDRSLLNFFFGVLFQASFRRDRDQHIGCSVLWHDPATLLSRPPSQSKDHDWSYLALTQPVPFNVNSLVQLAKAVEPGVSALAVHASPKQKPVIHGLVSYGSDASLFRFEEEAEPSCRDRSFRATIIGPAHITVDVGLDQPVELKWNSLNTHSHNVLRHGPVRQRLSTHLSSLTTDLQAQLPPEITSDPLFEAKSLPLAGGSVLLNDYDWAEALERLWTYAFAQILLKIFENQQGGAVVVTPAPESRITPKQGASYTHLRFLLEQRGLFWMTEYFRSAKALMNQTISLKDMPMEHLVLREPQIMDGPQGSDQAIHLAIAFIASLARLEGLLVLGPHLDVAAFGYQPREGEAPETVFLAGDEEGTEANLSPVPYLSFGARNQSLIRRCYQDNEALAFALTQDGDVRAMRWLNGKIVVWDRVRLHPRWDPI